MVRWHFAGAVGLLKRACIPDPGITTASAIPRPRGQQRRLAASEYGELAYVNGGKMNGFVREAEIDCAGGSETDVMGYHVRSGIPNCWAYA